MAIHTKSGWLVAGGSLALALFVGHAWVRHGPHAGLDVVSTNARGVRSAARARNGARARPQNRTDPEEDHVRKAGDLACKFNDRHGRLPRDIAEVRDWAVGEGKARPEDFLSTRDGQPYEFLNSTLAIIEHAGRNGRRFAYHPLMKATELNEGVLKVLTDSGVVDPGAQLNPELPRRPGRHCLPSPPQLQ
jgi:hypothetical protein